MTRYIWTTKTGEKVFVDEMDDSHLLNAHRLLREAKHDLSLEIDACYSMSFQGEMAQDAQMSSANHMEDMVVDVEKTIKVLSMEIQKRNIQELEIRR